MLRSEGWQVNHKRVERILREDRSRMPKKQKKRGRIYLKNGSDLGCFIKIMFGHTIVSKIDWLTEEEKNA